MELDQLKLCLGCGPTEALAVTLPAMGLCPDCLTQRGWAHLPTADVLRRLNATADPVPADRAPADRPPAPAVRPPRFRYRPLTAASLKALTEALTAWETEADAAGGVLRQVCWESLQQLPARLGWAVVVAEEVRPG